MLQMLKQRQEDNAASGSCEGLYNLAVGNQCDSLVNEYNMDCDITEFTNQDNSTSTLREICNKTCCQNDQAGSGSNNTAEKKAKQLPFDFEGM